MKKWAWASSRQCFQLGLLKERPTLFHVVVAPNVLTNSCIQSLVGWEATASKFKSFYLPTSPNQSHPHWQLYKIRIDITNVTKVGFESRLPNLSCLQKLLIKIKKRAFLLRTDKSLINFGSIQLDTLCGSCHQGIYKGQPVPHHLQIEYLQGEWPYHYWTVTKPNSLASANSSKILWPASFYLSFFSNLGTI